MNTVLFVCFSILGASHSSTSNIQVLREACKCAAKWLSMCISVIHSMLLYIDSNYYIRLQHMVMAHNSPFGCIQHQ